MKDLYVLGAGDLAKELIESIQVGDLRTHECEYKLKACVDMREGVAIKGIERISQEKLLDNTELKSCCFILATAHPSIKRKIISEFGDYYFPSFYHKTASGFLDKESVGKGNIFTANTYISSDVKLGELNLFNWSVSVGHDSSFGIGNTLNPGSRISGYVQFGDYNFVGANAVVLEGLSLEHDNTIGASSLLRESIESNQTWVGVPARKIKG